MSAKSGSLSIVCVQLGLQKVSVILSSRVSTIQGIEVNGRAELSVISWVSTVEGCPLSGVPLYCGDFNLFEDTTATNFAVRLLIESDWLMFSCAPECSKQLPL